MLLGILWALRLGRRAEPCALVRLLYFCVLWQEERNSTHTNIINAEHSGAYMCNLDVCIYIIWSTCQPACHVMWLGQSKVQLVWAVVTQLDIFFLEDLLVWYISISFPNVIFQNENIKWGLKFRACNVVWWNFELKKTCCCKNKMSKNKLHRRILCYQFSLNFINRFVWFRLANL